MESSQLRICLSMPSAALRMALRWSMSALTFRDPLLWDYVDALKASPGTPSAVKKELANLFTNPAFRYQGRTG